MKITAAERKFLLKRRSEAAFGFDVFTSDLPLARENELRLRLKKHFEEEWTRAPKGAVNVLINCLKASVIQRIEINKGNYFYYHIGKAVYDPGNFEMMLPLLRKELKNKRNIL